MEERSDGDSGGGGDGALPLRLHSPRSLLVLIHFLHSRNLLIVIRLNIHFLILHFLILPDYLPGSL